MVMQSDKWLSLPKQERQNLLRRWIARQDKTSYINLISAGQLGVFASLGVHFNYAIFGRDSLQVAEDLLESNQPLARQIIHVLASLQGVKQDPKSEEEPGKIHHEYRARVFNGAQIPEVSLNIMKQLQQNWGDVNASDLRYYGTFDATPLYIRLIGRYVQLYGNGLLSETYSGLDGQKTIADSVRAATNWLIGKIEASPWLLLEFKRQNLETGITNQVWKDSATSYMHLSGDLANHDSGIASIELQGYAYDALQAAAKIVASSDTERNDWLELAKQIQKQTIDRMWMPKYSFFAQGLDRSKEGKTRQIETLTSNVGLLLDSNLLKDLPDVKRSEFVQAIVQIMTSQDFMTQAGIRCRALRHKNISGFVAYHGSYTVWPKETYALARGLRLHGLASQAALLESKILHAIMQSSEFYEFFYVNEQGGVWYDPLQAIEHFKQAGLANRIATPESCQAWTISALEAILYRLDNER